MTERSLADQLLDAQVAYLLDRLTGDALRDEVAAGVDDVLVALADVPLAELLDRDRTKAVVGRLVAGVPASAGASRLVRAVADVIHEGPARPFALSELIDREHVEMVIDEALTSAPAMRAFLDELADSPIVATLASRFVGRIVGDVLSANRAVAEKIPGVGGLVSRGAGAASKVIGVADKQLEAIIGDTTGKGAAFAMRRLNKIVADTMADPMTKDAALEVWDRYADETVPPPKAFMSRDDAQRISALMHEIVMSTAPTAPVRDLVDALVDVLFDEYGEQPLPVLLEDLEITRDALVADAVGAAPAIVDALRRNGALERAMRARLEPFFASDQVAAMLA